MYGTIIAENEMKIHEEIESPLEGYKEGYNMFRRGEYFNRGTDRQCVLDYISLLFTCKH